jgi:cellulose synthase/poly-beta-1,6-N-acetylglucosamine synthase-like glycosyltransferase
MALTSLFYFSLLLVFYTYIGYGILLWLLVQIRELFRPKRQPVVPGELPEVTLFIAAYNEEEMVEEKMANCLALDYPAERLRILWVTDGSTDLTNEKLKAYPGVEVHFQPERRGKTAAINRGMTFVKSPVVLFTDANTLINPAALKEMVKAFTDPKTGCVAGEKRIAVKEKDTASSGGEGAYWRYESLLKELDSRLYSTMGAAGELFAIRTHLFRELPVDTLLDDFVLSLQIAAEGYRIHYCKEAYAVESASLNMQEEEKRKVRIAAGGLQSVWRLRRLLNPFRHGWLTFQLLSHRVLRWTITPVALFLLLPMNLLLLLQRVEPAWFFQLTALLQVLFYLAAWLGSYLAHRAIKNKLLFIPYYFLFMNLNPFKGAVYLCRFNGNAAWEKAKRSSTNHPNHLK